MQWLYVTAGVVLHASYVTVLMMFVSYRMWNAVAVFQSILMHNQL